MVSSDTSVLFVRLPVALHNRLGTAAWRARQSRSEYIRALLTRVLADAAE